MEVIKRNELHAFVILPKRWVVERSFGWLEECRRLWKNCPARVAEARAGAEVRSCRDAVAGKAAEAGARSDSPDAEGRANG